MNITAVVSSVIAILTAAIIVALWKLIYQKRVIAIGEPKVENPYGNTDTGTRNLPFAVRFLRVPITSRIFKSVDVECKLRIRTEAGDDVDCPNIIHWERQRSKDKAHTLDMHQNLKSQRDIVEHMYQYHFIANEPITIQKNQQKSVDLLMKIDGLDYAITTNSSENHLYPGIYHLLLIVSSRSPGNILTKFMCIEVRKGIDGFAEVPTTKEDEITVWSDVIASQGLPY